MTQVKIKNQQYQKVSAEAQIEFNKRRVIELSKVLFPFEQHHPKFQMYLQRFLKFNSARQMRVLEGTWMNMCTFNREFFYPEMEVCMEILQRITPNEAVNVREAIDWYEKHRDEFEKKGKNLNLNTDQIILLFYNDVAYPEVMEVIKEMKALCDAINNEVSGKIAAEINSQKKISLQLPVGYDINFVNVNVTGGG